MQLILFTDIGDTIIDEGSEVREVPEGVVQRARCIPGARETMLELYRRGIPIVMVADGLEASFRNTMRQNGLDHIFRAWIMSERVGRCKPDPAMFQAAMDALDLTDADKPRILMVGNNISRDIAGANRFGLRSALLRWSPRYPYDATSPDEVPDYTLDRPEQLPALIDALLQEEIT